MRKGSDYITVGINYYLYSGKEPYLLTKRDAVETRLALAAFIPAIRFCMTSCVCGIPFRSLLNFWRVSTLGGGLFLAAAASLALVSALCV